MGQSMQKLCQSCAMPMTEAAHFGTEKNGEKSAEYCTYCYKDGSFTADIGMDEMIEFSVEPCVKEGVYPNAEAARAAMKAFFPMLKRWA